MFSIKIHTGNAAFEDATYRQEIIGIVARAMPKLSVPKGDDTLHELILRDSNGAKVGTMQWQRDQENDHG